MNTYLDEINEEFSSKQFNDWHINIIIYNLRSDFSHDPLASVLNKYSKIFYSFRNITVEPSDAQIIIDNYKASYNVLVRGTLDYLLSTSSLRDESNFINDCKEYIELYFKNIKDIDGGFPAHNLAILLKWTLYKYPSEKNSINEIMYASIMEGKEETIRYISLSDYLLRDKELNNLFNKEQYVAIIDKYYKKEVDLTEVEFYLDTYNDFLKYFDVNDKKEYSRLLEKYCDYIFYNLANISDNIKQTELQKVRQYMDYLGGYNDKDYQIIDKELERVNKIQLAKLKHYSNPLSDNQVQEIQRQIENNTKVFKSLSNGDKIIKLIIETLPLSLKELKENYEARKNGLSAFFKEIFLDEDGRVINYKELSAEQEFSLVSGYYIGMTVNIFWDLIFRPFRDTFKMDDEAKLTIRDFISNNKLVDQSRVELLADLFITFFERDYKNSIYNIVLELEESIRYYLKQCGMNIMKRNGSGDYIGLNNIFNDNKNNSYRDELLKVIDEDYYFTLKWFLTDEYGFDIRDKISHRIKTVDLYKSTFATYITLQIIRLYWGFQK